MAISLASIQAELLPGFAAVEGRYVSATEREMLRALQLTRRAIADNLYKQEFTAPAFSPPIVDPTTIDLSAPVDTATASPCWPPKVDLLIEEP